MGPCGQTRWLWTTLHIRSPVAHHMHCTDQKTEAVDSGREEAHHLHNTDHHTVYERGVDAGHCQPGARRTSRHLRACREEFLREEGVGGLCTPTGLYRGIHQPSFSLSHRGHAKSERALVGSDAGQSPAPPGGSFGNDGPVQCGTQSQEFP